MGEPVGLVRTQRVVLAAPAVGAHIGAAYWFTSSSSFANPAATIGRILTTPSPGVDLGDNSIVKDPLEGLTAEGMIRTGVARRRVPALFAPILLDVRHEFDLVRIPSAELHLYGSVGTGQARSGESDVDLMVIDGSPDWAEQTSSRLSRRYADVCRGVEIGAVPAETFSGPSDEAYGFRVFLRHYCVSIAGPSLGLSRWDALRSC